MEVIRVPGATGFIDTDYKAKARYAVDALDRLDFVYMHVEAPERRGTWECRGEGVGDRGSMKRSGSSLSARRRWSRFSRITPLQTLQDAYR